MPAVSTITREEVLKAANTVAQRGEAVTYKAVRDALGGSGSFGTLAPFIKEWKELQKRQAAPAPVVIPEAIAAATSSFSRQVWDAAERMIREQVAVAGMAADASRAEAAAELAELQQVIDQLEKEAATRLSELEQAQHQAAAFEGQARTAQVEAREVRGQLTAAEARIAGLQREARELAAAAGAAQARREEDERRLAEMTQRFNNAAAAASRAEDELVTERQDLKIARSGVARAENAMLEAVAAADGLEEKVTQLTAEVKELTERASRAEALELALRERVQAEAERNHGLTAHLQEIMYRLGQLPSGAANATARS